MGIRGYMLVVRACEGIDADIGLSRWLHLEGDPNTRQR